MARVVRTRPWRLTKLRLFAAFILLWLAFDVAFWLGFVLA